MSIHWAELWVGPTASQDEMVKVQVNLSLEKGPYQPRPVIGLSYYLLIQLTTILH
jgi:hypothetical protein